jgi:glycosyltransferase involved in cell wall biosynthesis
MADDETEVNVLLSTYNGSRFLRQQMESILSQTHRRLSVLTRDDGSSDNTRQLIAEYADRYPAKIKIVNDGDRHLGVCLSYARLLERAEAGYVMLCDQDDCWLPEKVAISLRRMKQCERLLGSQCPILVHTDLFVADVDLKRIHDSFWGYQAYDPVRQCSLNRLLTQNVVTGCASIMNRALLRKALPIPPQAIIHDWWLALVAAAIGRLEPLADPTVLYRQHGGNAIGARRFGVAYIIHKAIKIILNRGAANYVRQSQDQARALLERLSADLGEQQRATLQFYADIARHSFLGKRVLLIRHGFLKQGWARNIGLFVQV